MSLEKAFEEPDDARSAISPQVVIHLVHGTWPYGPLPKIFPPKELGWFEEGSRFRNVLLSGFDANSVVFGAPFSWSGRNSFADRKRAARSLVDEISRTHERWPQCRQMIVAHSHGGTIAALAMSEWAEEPDRITPLQSVKTLVCLSTPFAYLSSPPKDGLRTLAGAFSSVVGVAIDVCLVCSGVVRGLSPLAALSLLVAVQFVVTVPLLITMVRTKSNYQNTRSLLPHPGVYLMRTAQDEASLSIGLAQSVHWIAQLLSKHRLPINIFAMSTLAMPIYLLLKAYLSAFAALPSRTLLGISMLMAFTAIPMLYAVSYVVLAGSTGLKEMRSWGKHTIQVESVPVIGRYCSVRTYRLVEQEDRGLRHSQVYGHSGAIYDMRELIKQLLG